MACPTPLKAAAMLPLAYLVSAALGSMHRVIRPPASAELEPIYARAVQLRTTRLDAAWSFAQQPALDALQLLERYLTFTTAPPPIVYVPKMDNDTVGKYYYDGNTSIRIEILNDATVTDPLQFYVVLHELLHFAGFGNLHGTPNNGNVLANWQREFDSATMPQYDAHWTAVQGTHRRLGTPATAEIMTAKISGNTFLSATTLMACTRNTIEANVACIDATDCSRQCVHRSTTFPGECDANVSVPHTRHGSDESWVVSAAAALSVFVVFAAVMAFA